ncbi:MULTISPECIES: hypothetical protein [Xanthomonas]|uniref:Uncharacterized protein n=1 Tax=Xanthomonas citri pv. citri TaxID=611301 RepID=A0A8I0HCR1_XANCI|nr:MULTISPECIES: hypothetical protein [Xanthomonas]MBD3988906.1 hypothetical protein [Xanthomonas citri pv. citri]MBD4089550.1 hypothetical protein [Xanthomonas citri pv. citri]MBD4165683.1 hypothetical protein [Xanthomonas citri pv. citri]MBD4340247.1 hypothetical protein [Xanthomonas citri pv. citri]MBD4446011.1 hypothetical protein [Xanthomonas citri pv. citri]
MRAPCRSRLRFLREIAAPVLTGQAVRCGIAVGIAAGAIDGRSTPL